MKNIAILIPSLKSGGAEKQAVLLAASLSRQYNVFLLIFYGEMSIAEANAKILSTVTSIHVEKLCGSFLKKILLLYKLIKTRSIDVALNYLTLPDVCGSFIERVAGVKRVYNGIRNSRLPFLKFIIEKTSHNCWATGTVFNCYSGAEYFMSKGFRKSKCIVIPNCYPNIAEYFERKPKEVVNIITVGRFVPQKDYETAIKTISFIKDKKIHFDIVGYGELEHKVRDWVKQYGISDIASIHINPNNVQDLLRSSDIYLSTSLFEGTSNSIMEAMDRSLPVVATNVGDNTYLVADGRSGYLHSIGDAEGMAMSLITLIESAETRNIFGKEGNQILHQQYSLSLFEKNYINLIETLVSTKKSQKSF